MSEEDKHYDFAKAASDQAVTNANIVLRTLLLINGGAAIALLAFIGNVVTSNSIQQAGNMSELSLPLLWFGLGVVATVLAMVFAYFTNYVVAGHAFALYAKNENHAGQMGFAKRCFHILAIVATTISLGFFLCGLLQFRDAITTLMP